MVTAARVRTSRRHPAWCWIWLVAVVITLLIIPGPARALQDDDLIVTKVGFGFEEAIVTDCAPDPGGQARAFQSEYGLICILRLEPMSPEFIELGVDVFRDPTLDQFVVGSVTPSAGVIFPPNPDPAYAVTFGAGSYLYTIYLLRSASPAPFDEQSLLIDLAEAHVDLVVPVDAPPAAEPERPGSEASTTTQQPVPIDEQAGRVDPQLGGLLVDVPGLSRTMPPIPDVHLTESDFAEFGEVGEALGSGTSSLLQFYDAPGGLVVAVLIAEYKFPLFAAAALGNGPALGADPSVVLPPAHQREGMIGLGGSRGEPAGAAFRQGATLYLVLTAEDIPVGVEEAYETVGAVAAPLYDAGPGGATSSFVFPTTAAAAGQTLLLVGALGAGIAAARSLTGRQARRIRQTGRDDTGVVDLTGDAATVRRRGWALFVIQLVAIGALVVGLTVLNGLIAVVIVVAAVAIALLAARYVRRADLPRDLERPTSRPSGAGVILGVAALAMLSLGVALLVRGAREALFRPSLAQLELADQVGIDPNLLAWGLAAAGLVLLVAGASVYRLARRRGRATADRLRRQDTRPDILYLRSFEDDALPIRTTFSARRPFFESFSLTGREPFESAVAWQIGAYGPVVAVGQPGRPLASLGAAREHLPAEEWQRRVDELIDNAQAIVMVVGKTEGLAWEVDQVAQQGYVTKTVFVTPPLPRDELQERWDRVVAIIGDAGMSAELAAEPEQTIATVFDRDGSSTVFSATRRGEASYRVCVDAAIGSLTKR